VIDAAPEAPAAPEKGEAPSPLRPLLVGLGSGLLANVAVLVAGYAACGSASGEIPPFLVYLTMLWVIQLAYLGPAMIVLVALRRPYVALGLLVAAVVTGVPSALLLVFVAASSFTV